jgi:hypothetical protein
MDKVLTSLGTALLLVGGMSVAQDKAPSGHAGMAKGPSASDAATIKKATSAAPADNGRDAAVVGTVDGKM